jgi:hypothetical protein
MADEADISDIAQQKILEALISNSRCGSIKIEGDGVCLACGKAVTPVPVQGRMVAPRWCGIKCRDVYDKRV